MRTVKTMLYSLCVLIIIVSAYHLWDMERSEKETTALYEYLSEQYAKQEEDNDILPENDDIQAGEHRGIIHPWINELKNQNQDLEGWIRIPNTNIDYPVMQTKEDNDYYLTHTFEYKNDRHGTPFIDVRCTLGTTDNVIIYGHHMKDGTMFQNLMMYKEPAFCENNERIHIYTAEEDYLYEVVYVLLLSPSEIEAFPYYDYINFKDAQEFADYKALCEQYSAWKSKDSISFGEDLLTLSTCEYSKGYGRLALIAKQVESS